MRALSPRRHCEERSETIQAASAEACLDCFAALAMTEQEITNVAQAHTHTN
jgi:hypothetical protein